MSQSMAAPNFGLSRYRSHKRTQSENRQSAAWDAGINHLNKFQADHKSGMVRASSVRQSSRKRPDLSVKTNTETRSLRSESPSVPRSAAAAVFHRHNNSASSFTQDRPSSRNASSPVPSDISRKAADMLGVQDSPKVSLDSPVFQQPRKRPPKELMEPYSEGYYGLARVSMSLSDTCLVQSEDEEAAKVEESQPKRKMSLDNIPEGMDGDIQKLIREANKAFDAVGASLDSVQLGSDEISARTSLRPSPKSTPNSSPPLNKQPSKELEFTKDERVSSDDLNTLKEQDSRSSSESQASKESKGSLETKMSNTSENTTYSEPIQATNPTEEPESEFITEYKPSLKSHWSDSSSGSAVSVGVAHAVTAPLPPMRPGQQLMSSATIRNKTARLEKRSRGQSRTNRWGLSDGVHDILTGQRFKKPEVEELLTPDRLAQLKKSREQASRDIKLKPMPEPQPKMPVDQEPRMNSGALGEVDKYEHSPVALDKTTSKTSVDIGAEGVKEEEDQRPIEELPKAETEEPANIQPEPVDIGYTSDLDSTSEEDLEESHVVAASSDSSSPPSPPAKNPARQTISQEKASAPLPSLPNEAKTDAAPSISEEDDHNIYFRSTPFTLTNPTFKHGPITFSKAEIGRAALTMDDAMDWTAFQMAILGGAGEYNDDKIHDDDEQFCEDMSEWFGTFNTDAGGLIHEDEMSATPGSARSSLSSRSSSSFVSEEEDLPIPLKSELRSKPEDDGEVKFYQGGKFKPWDADNTPDVKPLNMNRQTMQKRDSKMSDSGSLGLKLSRTAMEPVVASADDSEDESNGQVRMGFNLNQDLGDYLQWEQAHMTGNGF